MTSLPDDDKQVLNVDIAWDAGEYVAVTASSEIFGDR
jgi:hypothetical protein